VKQAIPRTADRHGADWDPGWGWGLVNGYAALNALTNNATDVGFNIYCHGAPVWWESDDIVPTDPKIVAGVQNTIRCTVHNFGPVPAYNVLVKLGVYNFGNDDAAYDLCGATIVGPLDAGADTVITCDWIPKVSGAAPGTLHACLKAEVTYPSDTYDFSNCAQHNLEILQPALVGVTAGGADPALAAGSARTGTAPASIALVAGARPADADARAPAAATSYAPVSTVMQVTNPTHEWLSISVGADQSDLAGSGWTFTQSTFGVGLYPGDCPANVTLTLTPGPGARASVHVPVQC